MKTFRKLKSVNQKKIVIGNLIVNLKPNKPIIVFFISIELRKYVDSSILSIRKTNRFDLEIQPNPFHKRTSVACQLRYRIIKPSKKAFDSSNLSTRKLFRCGNLTELFSLNSFSIVILIFFKVERPLGNSKDPQNQNLLLYFFFIYRFFSAT